MIIDGLPQYFLVVDCGAIYTLPNGFVNFTDKSTTYNELVPVHCDVGFEIQGEHYITCLSDGSWSENTTCQAKGEAFSLFETRLEKNMNHEKRTIKM